MKVNIGEKMVQKIAATVCFCVFVNVITALPQPAAVTTKFPSLMGSNPKCPSVPLWQDVAHSIKGLAEKHVISGGLYGKLSQTLNEIIKECDNKVVELNAVDIKQNLEEDSKAKETAKHVDINKAEVKEANENDILESVTTEANKYEKWATHKSLIENLPPFIPIFKPNPASTKKVNSTNESNSGNSTQHSKVKNDRIILHYTKHANSKPGDNILEVKRVPNTDKRILTSTEVAASVEISLNPSPYKKYEHNESVSSTDIPRSNIIRFNSIRRPTTPTSLGYVPAVPIQNSHLQTAVVQNTPTPLEPVAQNVSPTHKPHIQSTFGNLSPTHKGPLQAVAQNVFPSSPTSKSTLQLVIQNNISPDTQIAKNSGYVTPFDNVNCHPLSPNSPCSGSVPETPTRLSVVPVTTPGNKQLISSSFLKKIVSFPCPCTNTLTPMPQNLVAVNIACNGNNKKTSGNTEKANVVFFKPEDVEVLNVSGDTLKKTKMTVLVPAYVSQIDI